MVSEAERVLLFWFGELGSEAEFPADKAKLWFGKDAQLDEQIRREFGDLLRQGRAGDLKAWEEHARSALALIILLDQFSRNLHRDHADSFSADARARRITKTALERGYDRRLRPVERTFMYMPLMHSENLSDQERCIELFKKLSEESPPALQSNFAGNMKYAVMHRDIIARFGRFPHRNKVLGRTTTPAEEEFLKGPNSSF